MFSFFFFLISFYFVKFIDVAPRNVVSRVEKKRMHPTVVERIVFSPDGMDMVTVDRRTGEQGYDDGKESILCLFVVLSSNHGVLIEVLLGFLLLSSSSSSSSSSSLFLLLCFYCLCSHVIKILGVRYDQWGVRIKHTCTYATFQSHFCFDFCIQSIPW